ncbi:ATP-binding cassette domain-containing protein [Nitrosomonas sp. JL21]|nr:ATP-binding cassette domain-containing protein [Nitrosomonas sp. JL21]
MWIRLIHGKVVRLYYICCSYPIAAHYNQPLDVHVKFFFMMRSRPYRLLLGRLTPHWKLLALALCAMFVGVTTLAVLPLFIQQLLDGIFIKQDRALVQSTLIALLVLLAVRGIANYMSNHSVATVSSRLVADVRIELFDKLLTLPIDYYRQLNVGKEIESLISQIHEVAHGTIRNIAAGIHDGLVIVGLMLCLFFLNQEFSVLLLFIAPLIMLIAQMTRSQLSKLTQHHSAATQNLSRHVCQSITQYREIRLNGGQTQESQRLGKIAQSFDQEEMRRISLGSLSKLIAELMTALIIVAALYFITQQLFDHSLTIADAGALIAAISLLINPIRRSAELIKSLQHSQPDMESVWLFLDRVSEEDSATQYLKRIQGKLEFKQLRVQKDSAAKPILGPINLTIKPGETIVFTGYTDEEKNTLIDLILRMQQPSSGNLTLDDHSLNDIILNCLHSNIGIIMKDSRLLSDKIAGNIAYGKMRCAHELPITAAAQASHAMAFIREMPEGLQTPVGKDKFQLTQMQRYFIAIARNFLKNPPILILDEVLGLDTPDSGRLFSALDELTHQRTTLVFSRHIPTLKKIDRIVVLENGCITENLTHMRSSHHRQI